MKSLGARLEEDPIASTFQSHTEFGILHVGEKIFSEGAHVLYRLRREEKNTTRGEGDLLRCCQAFGWLGMDTESTKSAESAPRVPRRLWIIVVTDERRHDRHVSLGLRRLHAAAYGAR